MALWRSHHLLERAIGQSGVERLLGAIDAHVRGRDVEVPYVCRAWTARTRRERIEVDVDDVVEATKAR